MQWISSEIKLKKCHCTGLNPKPYSGAYYISGVNTNNNRKYGDPDRCARSCQRFEGMLKEGKRRAEGERGSRKRPRVAAEETEVWAEEMERGERRWKEDSGLLLGAKVARVIWQLSECLSSVTEELVVSQEAMVEESRLLCHVLVRNLRWIEMAFEGWGSQEEEGESEVEGAEVVEESERQSEERAE